MIRKVRMKFAAMAMAAMTVCTVVLILSINLLNYYQTDRRMESIVREIAVSERRSQDDGEMKNEMDGKERHSATTQYVSRFFCVTLLEDGTGQVFLKNKEALTETEALSLAEKVLKLEKTEGYLDEYKYVAVSEGKIRQFFFLDCSTELHAIRSLFITSVAVGAVGLIFVFLFVFFMSGKAIEPLKESMEKQKRFITDAGHELKTPLSAIATNMDLLEMDLENNEWVDSTKRQVRKLRKLVNHLISLSRLEETQQKLELSFFSASDAATECADTFLAMAEMEGKNIEMEIEENLTVYGNEASVKQIFTILCDNAVKYAQGDPNIQVHLYGKGRKVIFETVNDWDHGIESGDLDQVFERFFRGDSSRTTSGNANGYGLGLSIAKAAAEKNHAKLCVFEDAQKKLVFRVILCKNKKFNGDFSAQTE
ncbi:MAG: HAMP domain-containing sensor histidine kinase [Lachnospiraceae bacterium]|nr:HAMP domain-containing histidine kinase [Robinsoniella sp.]MDY3766251.1 HAMP domain-containing sensor histidine kinase [Lachnospiraceae bacterium]